MKLSMTTITVDLDTSGQAGLSINLFGRLLIHYFSFYWGTKKITWGLFGGYKDNGTKVWS